MVSIDEIRKNIILKKGVRYFDYTASGLAYAPIERRIAKYLKTYANTHSESASNALKTQKRYEKARQRLKDALGLDERFYLISAGCGATGAIKKFEEIVGLYLPPMSANRLGEERLKGANLPLVIISPYEHHSNEISLREGLCEVVRIPLSKSGEINFGRLDQLLKINSKREIIGSFSAASNVTGIISDYKKIYVMMKRYGATVAFDAASFSSHDNLDADYFDALFLSPHKLLGGVGSCGLLAIKKELVKSDKPTFAAGGTVSYVSRSSHFFAPSVERTEEGGTQHVMGLIRAALAYRLRNEVGLDVIKSREDELARLFCEGLDKIPEVVSYCPRAVPRLPIFAFNVKGVSPYDFAEALSKDYGVQTRAGCACAGPYGHDLLGLKDDQKFDQKPGWVRVSLHYSHTQKDVAYLLKAIKKTIKKFKTKKEKK
ncbi:aminotransferase, class V [Campylobacter rectus RM3267]|uniref:Aminotransferase, class V n=2 Tax=Campylobacter rectus TaxID=203 RepID=B9D1B4_CAMRE|nr:aminotransferase class V-fold PLP-dependent enzyme [Campylobacter rectus]EEF14293.1 aminotransferase, class V [Campylobacter rectus RM3267]QCD46265.1 putative selenocysteine lyase/cysteine desulfurase [Campylobacter rectus]UEB46973.1 aminotransferase class V-fold PLP-dependent enzyme [Campylobacter rectus]